VFLGNLTANDDWLGLSDLRVGAESLTVSELKKACYLSPVSIMAHANQ
jgi:hypothetical protein